jgi:hypothetical protein
MEPPNLLGLPGRFATYHVHSTKARQNNTRISTRQHVVVIMSNEVKQKPIHSVASAGALIAQRH